MVFIFFIYGLAFFLLGLLILIYPKKGSAFKLADNLWLVAAFGIIHGVNEWIDMFLLIQSPWDATSLRIIRLATLPASFYFLIQFGTAVILESRKNLFVLKVLPTALPVIWAVIVMLSNNRFLMGDIWARYLLAVPGIFLTSTALFLQLPDFEKSGMQVIIRYLKLSAWAFLFYGFIAGIIVPEAGFFPASVFNYSRFLGVLGVPVQVFRAMCALIAAYSISRVLDIFNWEAKDALRESEEKFRNIYMLSPIGIQLYDVQGKLIDANKASLEMFGVTDISEIKGANLFKDPNLADEIKEALSRFTVLRHEFYFDFEKVKKSNQFKTSKSGGMYVDYLVTPLVREANKSLYGYMVQIQDITKHKNR